MPDETLHSSGPSTTSSESTIPQGLVEALRTARHVAILTGAGISAESGIPNFRDAQTGLWSKFRPEDLATREAFTRNPRLVWEWYDSRRAMFAESVPNAGHLALVELEQRVPQLTLITQNIDGLHQRAGSVNVIELHGNIARNKCFDEDTVVESLEDTGEVPPRCPDCGGMLRPDVVWFGELLPLDALDAAKQACIDCDVFLSIGTSGLVEPAASMPYWAMQHGAIVAIMNLDVVPQQSANYFKINGPAGVVLPELVRAAWPI